MPEALFDLSIVENKESILILKITGKDCKEKFKSESGIHRWQRVPPNEKRGRVHTSCLSVAVLEIPKYQEIDISDSDLEWSFTRGSGAGGQHRNKTDTAAILHHKPTGIKIRSESCKSQYQNKQIALEMLAAKLKQSAFESRAQEVHSQRKKQVGGGMRAEKVRTIRLQDGIVKNHLNGNQISAKHYLRGNLESLI